ncbi:MAG: exo-alpha-sialidase [Prevotella sp.]|nr:exo-alpha-sialidase [Prevotella sp.]
MKRLSIALLSLLLVSYATAQTTVVNYVKSGLRATLRLGWHSQNYGTIQWQQSSDQGKTWKDIAGATDREYELTPSADAYLRVVVSGDEACEPFVETHILRVVNFSVDLVQALSHEATFEISGLNVPAADVADYGFCYNFSGVNRTYASMQRCSLGAQLPEGTTFEATCPGLLPNKQYSIRFYLRTKDGSTIYGPGKLTSTIDGLEWHSEDWTITKNTIKARFKISGYTGSRPAMTFQLGTDDANMKNYNITTVDASAHIYQSVEASGLQPGTEYKLRVTADIDGDEQVIEKTVRTMTDYSTYTVDEEVKPISHRLRWKSLSTSIQLNPDNIQAEYPRLLRVSPDTLLLTYHGGDGSTGQTDHWLNIYLQRSTDNGKTWSAPEKILDKTKTWLSNGWNRFTNADMIRLQNGWVLMTWSSNANPETNQNCQVFVMISKDGGQTWGDPITVLRGRCWEPQIVQLPGGELELLVSSEAYWWDNQRSNMFQEIVCARSTDNGETWTAKRRASYNPGKRDGMPVQVVMQGNKGILCTIESINSDKNPSILWRPLDGEWDSADWDEVSDSRRWVCENIRGGCAPYCMQLTTGEILVMGHLGQNGDVWQTNREQVTIGDNTGHNFAYRTIPFSSLPRGEGAYYSALFQKDANTIWLLWTHSKYNGSVCQKNTVELLEGEIIAF